MATIPVHNPSNPFLGLIPGGFRPNNMIRIRGILHAGRVNFDFQCGPVTNPKDDVALHLSIRPQESTIIRNAMQNQVWGPEERHGPGCPIAYGQVFDILVLAEAYQFKIAVNNVHYCVFPYRNVPLHRVQYISVGEMVGQIHYIGMESGGGSYQPPVAPPPPHVNYPPIPPPMPTYKPPYSSPYQPPGGPPPGLPPVGGVPVYPIGAVPPAPPPPYSPYPSAGGITSVTTTTYADTSGHPAAFSYGFVPHDGSAYYPRPQSYAAGQPSPYHNQPYQSSGPNKGLLGAIGGGTAAALAGSTLLGKKGKKHNKALKYAAGAGVLGLGGYALHRALKRSSSSSSSSSSD